MEREVGIVVRVMDGEAEVMIDRPAACDGCKASSQCSALSDGKRKATVLDPLGVKEGDSVELELGGGSALLKASLLVYMVPLVSLFVGAILGIGLSHYGGWSISDDLIGIIFGVGFLVLAFAVMRLMNRRLERSPDFRVRVTKVLGRSPADIGFGDREV